LTAQDLDLILQALEYQKQAFTDYKDYPTYEFKQAKVARVETIIGKVRAIRNAGPH
jgi:hypothetical protein